jgi:nicotinamide-nucleotide amidase
MNTSSTQDLVSQLASALLEKRWHLSTAESCTGGLVAATITELAGSSDWFERGYVTYSNSAKSEDIHVSPELIAQHGAVSDQVARAMAVGAKQSSHTDVALSITGIAGPTGGSTQKPAGTVCFAWILANDAIHSETKLFSGNRQEVRQQACEFSLKRLLELLLIE